MSVHALNRLVATVAEKASLQTILIVPFVLQMDGRVGLMGYLSFRNRQKAVEDLIAQIREQDELLANALASLAKNSQVEQLLALTQLGTN